MSEYLTNRQAMQAYLDGKPLEYLSGRAWHPSNHFTVDGNGLDAPSQYRLAPTTITRTVTYPKPVTEPLAVGQMYYVPMMTEPNFYIANVWQNHGFDDLMYDRGLIYITKADAIAHAKAMIGGVE